MQNSDHTIGSELNTAEIQNQILMIKKLKQVNNNKIINQAIFGQGIRRFDTMPSDVFVLTRKLGVPELVYNNNSSKDLYWEL